MKAIRIFEVGDSWWVRVEPFAILCTTFFMNCAALREEIGCERITISIYLEWNCYFERQRFPFQQYSWEIMGSSVPQGILHAERQHRWCITKMDAVLVQLFSYTKEADIE